MADERDPDLFDFRPPMTAKRDRPMPLMKAIRAGAGLGRATPEMSPRHRARHFSDKAQEIRVRPVRSAAGGQRRVMVKVRVVKMGSAARKALMTHVRYVARDGAGVEGEQGRFFDARADQADAVAFARRCEPDRHHFRVIVNPEDGRDLPDLKAYARKVLKQVETDMGTPIDWIAGAHYDTGRPHLHILMRGKRDDGRDLVLPRDYVSHGLRGRAQELATEILGPRLEVAANAERDLTADRFTRLDQTLLSEVRDGRLTPEGLPETQHSDALRRLVHLETRGWVQRERVGIWSIPSDLRETLQRVGEHHAREAAATRAIWGGRWGGEMDRLQPLEVTAGEPLVGAYAGVQPMGPYGNGPQVMVMETLDGRLGHVRLPSLDKALILDRVPERAIVEVRGRARPERASDRTIAEIAAERGGEYSAAGHRASRPEDSDAFIERHVRRLEAMRREGVCRGLGDGRFAIPADYVARASAADQARHGAVDLEVRVLDVRPLELQPQAKGITWLDTAAGRLGEGVEAGPLVQEARAVGVERAKVLQSWGIGSGEPMGLGEEARRQLWKMEFEGQMERLGRAGKPLVMAKEGQTFSGVYLDRAHMGGRTWAVIENRSAVTLAPWRPALEACRGQALTGVLQGGQVDFRFGAQAGAQLGAKLGRGLGLSL